MATGKLEGESVPPKTIAAPRFAALARARRQAACARPVAVRAIYAPTTSPAAIEKDVVNASISAAEQAQVHAVEDILATATRPSTPCILMKLALKEQRALARKEIDLGGRRVGNGLSAAAAILTANLLSRRCSCELAEVPLAGGASEAAGVGEGIRAESGGSWFEGHDAAGKGDATIKRFMEHLNPRGARVVALDKPTEVERGAWYFQRYVRHLPTAGEIAMFDRSWYNRAGVRWR